MERQGGGIDNSAVLADTVLVPSSDEIMCSTAHKNKNEQIIVDTETQTGRDTPLYRKLTLLACHVSGKVLKNKIYQLEQFRLL